MNLQNGCYKRWSYPKLINHFKLVKRALKKQQPCHPEDQIPKLQTVSSTMKSSKCPMVNYIIYNYSLLLYLMVIPWPTTMSVQSSFHPMARCHSRAQRFCSARQVNFLINQFWFEVWRCLKGILLFSFIFCLYDILIATLYFDICCINLQFVLPKHINTYIYINIIYYNVHKRIHTVMTLLVWISRKCTVLPHGVLGALFQGEIMPFKTWWVKRCKKTCDIFQAPCGVCWENGEFKDYCRWWCQRFYCKKNYPDSWDSSVPTCLAGSDCNQQGYQSQLSVEDTTYDYVWQKCLDGWILYLLKSI